MKALLPPWFALGPTKLPTMFSASQPHNGVIEGNRGVGGGLLFCLFGCGE